MKRFKDYRSLCRYFKEQIQLPLSIQRTSIANDLNGYVQWDGRKYIIRIHNKSNEDCSIYTLIHEIGHVLSFKAKEDHGKEFGIGYSKAYMMYLDWLDKR